MASYLATASALIAVEAYDRQCALTEDMTALARYIANISVNKDRFDFDKTRVELDCDREEMDRMLSRVWCSAVIFDSLSHSHVVLV